MNLQQINQFREIRAAVEPVESDKPGYKMFNGFFIKVEHPAGSVRSGVDGEGNAWSTTMQNDYGEIPGSLGSDGDACDVYLGPNNDAKIVHTIHMNKPDGSYDEDKHFLGFNSQADAVKAFRAHYPENSARIGAITSLRKKDFRKKVQLSKMMKNKGAATGPKFHASR